MARIDQNTGISEEAVAAKLVRLGEDATADHVGENRLFGNAETQYVRVTDAASRMEAVFGDEHPRFTKAEHQSELDSGFSSYWDWVANQIEARGETVDQAVAEAQKLPRSRYDRARWALLEDLKEVSQTGNAILRAAAKDILARLENNPPEVALALLNDDDLSGRRVAGASGLYDRTTTRVRAMVEEKLHELEAFLRIAQADQGGGATFDSWVRATANDPHEVGHSEAVHYLRLGGDLRDKELGAEGKWIFRDKPLSSRMLAEQYPVKGSMPRAVVEQLYQLREEEVATLSQRPVVTVDDLRDLDRLGRFLVADGLFEKCDDAARHALLHDEHPHVRSCAEISKRDLDEAVHLQVNQAPSFGM